MSPSLPSSPPHITRNPNRSRSGLKDLWRRRTVLHAGHPRCSSTGATSRAWPAVSSLACSLAVFATGCAATAEEGFAARDEGRNEASSRPSGNPAPGSPCTPGTDTRFSVEEECCGGECAPSLICECDAAGDESVWACTYTDFCLQEEVVVEEEQEVEADSLFAGGPVPGSACTPGTATRFGGEEECCGGECAPSLFCECRAVGDEPVWACGFTDFCLQEEVEDKEHEEDEGESLFPGGPVPGSACTPGTATRFGGEDECCGGECAASLFCECHEAGDEPVWVCGFTDHCLAERVEGEEDDGE